MLGSNRRSGMKGTVLIMILTVMFVLIIMLMATLTVVTTANQRVYTKYEENQAYYTARSALDVFTGKILNDGSYMYDATNTQGCMLQQSLYTVMSQDGNDTPIYGPVDKPYIEYTVELPKLSDGTDTYGTFGDDTIKIKVEVLTRTYNSEGDRTKDAMTLKVTATSSVMGTESSAAGIFRTKAPTAQTVERAVTITGDGEMTLNNSVVLGGFAAPVTASLGNDPCIWGDMFVGDGFASSVNLHALATDNEWIYLRGKYNEITGVREPLTLTNNTDISGVSTGADKMPNILIDGDATFGSSTFKFGNLGKNIKMIVNGNVSGSNGIEVFGDLFVIGNLNPNDHMTVHGNVYIMGNGDFTLAQNGVTIDGQLYATGSVFTRMAGLSVVNNFIVGGAAGNSALLNIHYGTLPVSVTGLKTFGKTDDVVKNELEANAGKIKIDWNGTESFISSEGLMYGAFYRYADLEEGTITASEYAFLSSEDLEKLMDPDSGFAYPSDFKRIHEYIDENAPSATLVDLVPGGSINSPGKYIFSPTKANLSGGTFTIDAGGEVEIFIEPGYYCSNGGKIVVETGTTVKFYGRPGQYNFMMDIVTREYEDGGDLYVGQYGSDGTPNSLMSIPISYYFEGESKLYFDTVGSTGSVFVGHLYAPRSQLIYSGSAGSDISSRLIYNKVDFMGNGGRTSRFSIIGSVVCRKYYCGSSQTAGVAFVKSSDAVIVSGMPQLNFIPVKYTRN